MITITLIETHYGNESIEADMKSDFLCRFEIYFSVQYSTGEDLSFDTHIEWVILDLNFFPNEVLITEFNPDTQGTLNKTVQ